MKKIKLFHFFLPHIISSTALAGIGTYTSYLGYNSNNDKLSFIGTVLLTPGLVLLGGLIYNNLKNLKKENYKNLRYRIKRFLLWESGIVEKVQEYPAENKNIFEINFLKDRFGNLPQLVTFRNPLGELKQGYSMEKRVILNNNGESYFAFRYRRYKVEDKFP